MRGKLILTPAVRSENGVVVDVGDIKLWLCTERRLKADQWRTHLRGLPSLLPQEGHTLGSGQLSTCTF